MPVIERHAPGSFCWLELAGGGLADAKKFYGGLFGWTARDLTTPGQPYSFFELEGKEIAGLYEMNDDMRKQAPPHWMEYVAVDDADRLANRARELGAALIAGPFDVFEEGRMAVLRDPGGAVFCLWQPKRHTGAKLMGGLNTLCWSELETHDTGKAKAYYKDLFGWEFKESPQYIEIYNAGQPIGGIMQIQPDWGEVPPHWMPYFQVADCDATTQKVRELGGCVYHGPIDIANVGRFSVLADAQGAGFAVIRLAAMHP